MNPSEPVLLKYARWLAFASAVAILFSIAASQILLALSFASLLLSGAKLRLPPIRLPLALFVLGTLLSLAFSSSPAAGLPQIRKLYVFLELVVVFSTFEDVVIVRRLFLWWAGAGALVSVKGFVQFARKLQEAHALGMKFYDFYVSERITGFMSHWMTFSGQEMLAFLMLVAFLFFAPGIRKRMVALWAVSAGLMGLAILLGFTRSIWLGSAAAGLYLLWYWKRYLVAVVPVVALVGILLSPPSVRERFDSFVHPRKGVDSNQFRIVTWRTGLEMIKAHPWFGLGPEEVKAQFMEYVPADIPRPLPPGWYGHLHNIYLHYAAERGIPFMFVLIWLLLKITLDFFAQVRKLPPGRGDLKFILHGAVAVMIAIMIEGFFELNLGDSEVLTMFLVVVACGYVALEAAKRKTAEDANA